MIGIRSNRGATKAAKKLRGRKDALCSECQRHVFPFPAGRPCADCSRRAIEERAAREQAAKDTETA